MTHTRRFERVAFFYISNMEQLPFLIVLLLSLNLIFVGVVAYFVLTIGRDSEGKWLTVTKTLDSVNVKIAQIELRILNLHKRIDQIFVIDKPQENEAMKEDPNEVELSEQNLMGVPSDVKFSVEGGDSAIPPGFKEA